MRDRTENKVNCIFIRHGITDSNLLHRYLGRTDEPLNSEGINELHDSVKKGIYPECDRLCSSPLIRCIQTAEIIYPGMNIETVDELSEMDFGEFELKNYMELNQDPRYRDKYQTWIDSGGTLAFPGGESRDAFIDRSVQGFQRVIAGSSSDETIAFIVHGGTIMAILSHYCGGDYFDYQVKNGCGYKVKICTDRRSEHGDNYISHISICGGIHTGSDNR